MENKKDTLVTREDLYEMVWADPMVKVGEKLGISSSYMTRLCKLMNVPRPSVGYWAKLEAGKAKPRPPLQEPSPSQKKFTPEQKKSFLEGLLAGVDVRLVDKKTHQLTINFQLPIVNDSLVYEGGKKSGSYVVHEGVRSLTVEQAIPSGSKKKDV